MYSYIWDTLYIDTINMIILIYYIFVLKTYPGSGLAEKYIFEFVLNIHTFAYPKRVGHVHTQPYKQKTA